MMVGKAVASEATLEFDLPTSPPLPHIVTDGRWLSIMTTNLVSNAIKHTRTQVRVTVSIVDTDTDTSSAAAEDTAGNTEDGKASKVKQRHQGSEQVTTCEATISKKAAAISPPSPPLRFRGGSESTHRALRVSVHDDGLGIPESLTDSLFTMYCRGLQRDGGTGIGLYSVKVQCETLGGRCGFSASNLLGGAEVWFEIPFRPDLMMATSAGMGDRMTTFGKTCVSPEVTGPDNTASSSGSKSGSKSSSKSSSSSCTTTTTSVTSADGITTTTCTVTTITTSPTSGGEQTCGLLLPGESKNNRDEDASINGSGSGRGGSSASGAAADTIPTQDRDQDVDEDHSPAAPISILLVDDSPIILMMVGAILEREGYAVDKATNGREGLERVQERDYDVVVSDLQMPVMDGFAMTSAVRAREIKLQNGRHQPVIVMSANTTEADIEFALSTGADAFLAKPAQPLDIISIIQEVLQKYPPMTT